MLNAWGFHARTILAIEWLQSIVFHAKVNLPEIWHLPLDPHCPTKAAPLDFHVPAALFFVRRYIDFHAWDALFTVFEAVIPPPYSTSSPASVWAWPPSRSLSASGSPIYPCANNGLPIRHCAPRGHFSNANLPLWIRYGVVPTLLPNMLSVLVLQPDLPGTILQSPEHARDIQEGTLMCPGRTVPGNSGPLRTLPKGLSDYAFCDNAPLSGPKNIYVSATTSAAIGRIHPINRNLWLQFFENEVTTFAITQSYRLTFECGHWYIRAMEMTPSGI